MSLTPYLIGGAFAAGLAVGGWAGYAWEGQKVEALVAEANKQVISELRTANSDLAAVTDRLHASVAANAVLEDALREAAVKRATVTETRIIWREKEREQNPDCAAWLDAPVPCRLRPDNAGDGGKAGADQGTAPKLRLKPISLGPTIRSAGQAG